ALASENSNLARAHDAIAPVPVAAPAVVQRQAIQIPEQGLARYNEARIATIDVQNLEERPLARWAVGSLMVGFATQPVIAAWIIAHLNSVARQHKGVILYKFLEFALIHNSLQAWIAPSLTSSLISCRCRVASKEPGTNSAHWAQLVPPSVR